MSCGHEWEQGVGQGKRLGLGNGLSHPEPREPDPERLTPTHTDASEFLPPPS